MKKTFAAAATKFKLQSKNDIPSSKNDEGAEGHGTVVFAVVTTIPCSGFIAMENSKSQGGTVE